MYVRGRFKKIGYIRLVGHLDTMKIIIRAFNRAGLPITYSEGFNKSPKLALSQSLPLGVQSLEEFVDFEINEKIDLEKAIDKINSKLKNGIRFYYLCYSEKKERLVNLIKFQKYKINFYQDLDMDKLEEAVKILIESESYIIKKVKINKKRKGPKYIETNLNIRSYLTDCYLDKKDASFYYTSQVDDQVYLRYDDLFKGLFEIMGLDFDRSILSVLKLSQLDENMKEISLI